MQHVNIFLNILYLVLFQSLKRDIPLCNINWIDMAAEPFQRFQSLKRDIPLCN